MPDLKNLLNVRCRVEQLYRITSLRQLQTAFDTAGEPDRLNIIGGASNLIPLDYLPGVTCQMALMGFEVEADTPQFCDVRVAAGENWHSLVKRCVGRGWFGVENLALIPGSVGAAPVQNIGAYGVEIAKILRSVRAFDTRTQQVVDLANEECIFGYRDSVFKSELAGRFVILSLVLRLSKQAEPVTAYADVAQELHRRAGPETPRRVMEAVVRIRRQKLPDPRIYPNVGSFFKNPLLDQARADSLLATADFVHWQTPQGVKFSAAQLIDRCGLKGLQLNGVGIWHRQPLVLVNQGATRGRDFLQMARTIMEEVEARFRVTLEIEPRVIGQDD